MSHCACTLFSSNLPMQGGRPLDTMGIGSRRGFEIHIMYPLSSEVTIFTNLTGGSVEHRIAMWLTISFSWQNLTQSWLQGNNKYDSFPNQQVGIWRTRFAIHQFINGAATWLHRIMGSVQTGCNFIFFSFWIKFWWSCQFK